MGEFSKRKGRLTAGLFLMFSWWIVMLPVVAATTDPATHSLLHQQQRERAEREQRGVAPTVRLKRPEVRAASTIPAHEKPCFDIQHIVLVGDLAGRFQWALKAANPARDPALGRCLGTQGINVVMTRVQNAVIERGYVTTRVLAKPQDLTNGTLTLTLIPGRIHAIRYAEGVTGGPTLANAIPARVGDLLNLRVIEQGLENLQRVPTVEAHIDIAPATGPGESDLVVRWQQRRPLRVSLSVDDSGARATGKWQASATLSLDNPLDINDLFYVTAGHSAFNPNGRGTRNYTFHYTVPFDNWRLSLTSSSYRYRQTVEGLVRDYTYSGKSHDSRIRLSRLLYRNATGRLRGHVGVWRRRSRNYIDRTEILVQRRVMGGWEAGLDYRLFLDRAIIDARASYQRGTGAFGALPAPEAAFGEGAGHGRIYRASVSLQVPFEVGRQAFRYRGSWRAQWNDGRLVSPDWFAIGGRYSVRGFDGERFLVGDRGWVVRNDLGWMFAPGQLAYVALDAGHVGGPASQWQLGHNLIGTGIGLRGGYGHFTWDLFAGVPLRKPDGFQTADVTTAVRISAAF